MNLSKLNALSDDERNGTAPAMRLMLTASAKTTAAILAVGGGE